MDKEKIYQVHIQELQKLSYEFYSYLARGKEPLTYSAKHDDWEIQVEVYVEKKKHLTVSIGFDTNFVGRFDRTKGIQHYFNLDENGNWINTDQVF